MKALKIADGIMKSCLASHEDRSCDVEEPPGRAAVQKLSHYFISRPAGRLYAD